MEENEEFDSDFNTEGVPISEEFWNYMEHYWHNNREFPESTEVSLSKKADLIDGKIPSSQLPSYVDDVLEFDSFENLPSSGEKGKIYLTTNNNAQFRWSGSEYIQINSVENVVTTNTNQNIDGKKSFITAGGSGYNNHSLRVLSNDASNPGLTFYRGGVDSAVMYFDGVGNFKFRNSSDATSKYLWAQGYKVEGSNDTFFVTGGGGTVARSNYLTAGESNNKFFPRSLANIPIDLNTLSLEGVYYGYQWTNNPVNFSSIATVTVKRYSPDWIAQEFRPIYNGSKIFVRNRHSGTTWTDWKEVATSDGFVPYTGAISDLTLADKNLNFTTGALSKFQNGTRIFSNVYQNYVQTTQTGILSFKFPPANTSATMFDITLKIYGYQNRFLGNIRVSFYRISSTSISGSGHKAIIECSDNFPSTTINIGIDISGNICINLGEITTIWERYLTVKVERVQASHSGANADWSKGWSQNIETTAPVIPDTYQSILNIVPEIVATRSWLTGQIPNQSIYLGTLDLNTITIPGFYNQIANSNATLARNYPALFAGSLNVYKTTTGAVVQEYTEYVSALTHKRTFTSAWTAWKTIIDSSSTVATNSHLHTNKANLDTINQNLGTTNSPAFADITATKTDGGNVNIGTGATAGTTASPKFMNLNFAGYSNIVKAKISSSDIGANSVLSPLIFYTYAQTGLQESMRIEGNGNIKAGTLSGTGTRMVVADAIGQLSTQIIPTYTLPVAASNTVGGLKLITDTVNNIAPNAVTNTANRNYAVQLNNLNQAVVNVPWSDNNTTYLNGTGLSLSGTTFSVNFGTAAGTAAQGNDSRINNGQTAFGWGNHAAAGYINQSWVQSQNYATNNFVEERFNELTGEFVDPSSFSIKNEFTTVILTENYSKESVELEGELIPGRYISIINLTDSKIELTRDHNTIDIIYENETSEYYITKESRLVKKGTYKSAKTLI